MHNFSRAVVASLAIVCIGCEDDTSNDLPPEFTAAQQKWQTANIRDYQFTLMMQCFCPHNATVITVRQGVIASAYDRVNGQFLTPQQTAGLPTIDGLFSIASNAYLSGASTVRVSYSDSYGYPINLFVDRDSKAVDDEIEYQVSEFM